MMNNSSVAHKFLYISLTSIGALILLGLYGLHNVQSTFIWVGEVYDTTQTIDHLVTDVNEPLNELRQWSLLLVTTPDAEGRAELSKNIQQRIAQINQFFQNVPTEEAQAEHYQQLNDSWLVYKDLVQYTHDKVMTGYREAAFINVSNAEQQQFEQIAAQLVQWRQTNVKQAEQIYQMANLNYQKTLLNALLFIAFVAIILGFFSWYVAKPLVESLRFVVQLANEIAIGNLETEINTASSANEASRLLKAFASMQTQLRERIAEDKRIADEALRINSALNNVSMGVLIADNHGDLIYLNHAALHLFTEEQVRIHQDEYFKNFDAQQLIGKNFEIFYRHPQQQRALISNLTQSQRMTLVMGELYLDTTLTPVINSDGERLGTVAEFKNITEQTSIEQEINTVVQAASQGDFAQRIELASKADFFRTVSEGLNQVIEFNQQAVKDTMRMFAALAQGDLSQQIKALYRGEFDQLKQDANNTVIRLTEVMSLIKQGAADVNAVAAQIADSSSSLSQRTEQQAAALQETAASMEEMTGTVQQNMQSAQQATELAFQAREHAEKGGEVVSNAVHAMNAINDSSRRITDIISVIDEIAFQTNLLALNAAVEAARAGEQGRGFAVVATEVRNLAQRSAAAAKEIKDLIRDSVDKVESGTRLVNQSGETLSEIMVSVQKVSDIVAEISAAGQEQSSGIHQVNKAITQMDEMTQQNGSLVQALTASSEAMNYQAKILNEQVAFFKLEISTESSPKLSDNKASAKPKVVASQKVRPALPAKVETDADGWEDF